MIEGGGPQPTALTRPVHSPLSPTFRTPNDDFLAEEMLKRRRINNSQAQNGHGGMKRAFTMGKKKGWELKEIFEALDAHVENGGSPGVAEALIQKLLSAGGDMNVAGMKSKTNLLGRRKSLESFERSRILQKAIDHGSLDMVTVLAPHADPLALDMALPIALRNGNVQICELLLRYGANASQTTDGQDVFRQLCQEGGQAELVGLILQSDGRPSPGWISQAMIDATKKGCLETVSKLSRSTADGNHNDAEALKESVSQCRVDIALAILTGNKPPNVQRLNEAFSKVFTHPTIMPNEKIAFTDALLCAGADGDVVSAALVQACATGFYEMINLLISYGASVEFQDAQVLRGAIQKGNVSLVQVLLSEQSQLSPLYASELVGCIPKRSTSEERKAFLDLLLRKGASGEPLNDALIESVENADFESVKLLLTPHFPGRQMVKSHDLRKGPRSMIFDRHAIADVNHRGGLALQLAALTGNLPMANFLLACKPSPETLAEVYPSISGLAPLDRFHMTQSFLAAGLTGPAVHNALQNAIEEQPPQRDDRLIKLLLQNDVAGNFSDGITLSSAIEHEDVDLLGSVLYHSKATPQVSAGAIPKVMMIKNLNTRAQMISLLLEAGAGLEVKAAGEATVAVLQTAPTDTRLLEIFLKQGKVDVNFANGSLVVHAVRNNDPRVLETVLRIGKPTPETLDLGVQAMGGLPSNAAKAAKVETIIRHSKHKETLNGLLTSEVQSLLKTPPQQRILATLKSLLAAGVDVNAQKAAGFCYAVGAADTQLTDLLFASKPKAQALKAAMPFALKIQDPMDRLTFTQRLLQAGAPATEANQALVYAVKAHPDDLPLINTLVSKADCSDGEALITSVRTGKPDVVELIISKSKKKFTAPLINGAFAEATRVSDSNARKALCDILLRFGASGPAVSEGLLAIAASSDVDLGRILIQHGASLDYQEGQAIVEACRAGASEVLKMLLSGKTAVQKPTLSRGFQAATEVGDLRERAAIFRLLLDHGVDGEEVDAQLVSAARFGDDAEDLVQLFLEHGASTDFNNGEAVWNATRCASMGILEMLLGIKTIGPRQQKPSHKTMSRALKASWKLSPEPRYQVIEWLFKAGLPIGEDIHVGLNKAVNDEEPNMALIELLVKNGASPLANGCQTLVDAIQKRVLPALDLFMQTEIPESDIQWAFSQAFAPKDAVIWLNDDGFKVAERLLEKGANGDSLGGALIAALDRCGTEQNDIARRFVELLTHHHASVNELQGLAVCKAAKSADPELIRLIIRQNPSSEAVSMAFPYLFDHELSEEQALEMITLFTDYHHEGQRLDAMFAHPESEPVIFRAISQYPRSSGILQALLDAGYYYDQMGTGRIFQELEEEPMNLLTWMLLQPQKKVSSSLITMIIEKGAKVNFETRSSKTTPIMLAIKERRQDIVRTLILAGAEVDVVDVTGNTPLTLATGIGGELGTTMMSNLLAAEPSKNDGSLHNAARDLNISAMQVLVEFGHDVDFPSPLHDGRSALGELCLHASDSGELTAAREKTMEKAMSFLIEKGSDLSVLSDGKPILMLALDAFDPLSTTKALLKVGMWKLINKPFNNFSDGTYIYSPTMYVKRVLPQADVNAKLLTLLRANRAQDVFYASHGPQPEDAVGLPDDIVRAERERQARLDRIATETEEHARALARTKEIADIQNQIFANRAQLEDARARRQRDDEMNGIREKARVEEEMFAAAVRRQKAERTAALEHAQTLTEAELSRTRLIAETEFEVEGRKQLQMLEYERQVGSERVDNAQKISAVRLREREDIDKLDKANEQRIRGRLTEQRRLVDSQNQLAGRLANGGINGQRQIGYVAGELT